MNKKMKMALIGIVSLTLLTTGMAFAQKTDRQQMEPMANTERMSHMGHMDHTDHMGLSNCGNKSQGKHHRSGNSRC